MPRITTRAELLNLLNSAKWHKEHCGNIQDTECNVSLFLLGQTYELLANRKLTEEEHKVFQ